MNHVKPGTDYRLLLDCWLSGQMSDVDMHARMRGEPLFALWVKRALRNRSVR